MVCEIEKPKVLGWAAKRRLRRVDLPVPEGPERTRGRGGVGGGDWESEVVVVVGSWAEEGGGCAGWVSWRVWGGGVGGDVVLGGGMEEKARGDGRMGDG